MQNISTNFCAQYESEFRQIDQITEKVNKFGVEPNLSEEIAFRRSHLPDLQMSDEKVLNRFADLIAYSNGAQSKRVTILINNGVLSRIFQDYKVSAVASMNAEAILQKQWSELGAIRFKYKVNAIIECAKILALIENRYGSFIKFLIACDIPTLITSESDYSKFWNGFDRVRGELLAFGIPYFGNFTSLCHLLLDFGFDCAKPDSAVMKAAASLGIVVERKKGNYREQELRKVIQTLQIYALCHSERTGVIDLYFLIHGGQTDSRQYVTAQYYG